MTTVLAVLSKEIRSLFLRLEVPLAVVLVCALALLMSDAAFREQVRLVKRVQKNEQARVRLLEDADNAWQLGSRVPPVRLPPPLRALALGGERVQPDTAQYRPEGYAFVTDLNANPLADLLPPPDLSFLVGVVLSLLVLLLAHDAVTGEREDGTLRLVFSFPVSRAAFLMGKALGGLTAVTLVLGVTACAVVLPAVLHHPAPLAQHDIQALWVLAALSWLYLAVYYLLGLVVSVVCDRSATSLATIILLWAVTVLILPNVTPTVAGWIVHAPSRMQAKVRLEHENTEIMRWYMDEIRAALNELDGQAFWDRRRELYEEREQREDEARRTLMADFQPRWDALNRTSERLALASPFAAYTLAAGRLCQTDPGSRRRLDENLQEYEKDVDRYLRTVRQGRFRLGPRYNARDLPKFGPEYENFHARLKGMALPAGVLAGLAAALFAVGVAVFVRRDVV